MTQRPGYPPARPDLDGSARNLAAELLLPAEAISVARILHASLGQCEQRQVQRHRQLHCRREAAAGALFRMGSKAVPALRKAAAGPNADVRTRASRLLVRLEATSAAEKLRLSRIVQGLELAGTAAARELLEEWATTAPNPQLARESADALARLMAKAP